jgi:hypothetical protein
LKWIIKKKIDPLLIEPHAEFRDADKIKTPLPYAEEGAVCAPTSPKEGSVLENLYAQVNKKKYEKLDGIELANQPGASPAAYTRITAVNGAEKPYVGLETAERKDESSAKREYTSLTSGVNSPNATLDTDSLAKDPLTQEGKSYETLAPDKMETFNASAPTSSSAYVPLSRNNDKDYTTLDSSQRDAKSHAIVDYTSLKIDSQNAT